ncbi:MAG: hypothetical protein FJW40_16020 [Acidobacteria bacterium]|nr:hypothetical protein [Acidobacteriota bacterium]
MRTSIQEIRTRGSKRKCGLDLPLASRDAIGLVYINAGVVGDNFAGARIGTLNITFDGINVQDNRVNNGVSSTLFTSVDMVEEFKVVTSPADAEYGRGSGQIQMLSRSGSNVFRGSLFHSHRNTIFNANTWFNNQRGLNRETLQPLTPRNILLRNQYGGRVGGPVRRNRTFFHVLYEAQRQVTRNTVNATVYTATARAGLYRFFPGLQNGNAGSATPSVDLAGSPVRPARATGDLVTANLFQRDPARPVADPTGNVQRLLALTPLPNNFLGGDGLNTAWHTWQRPATSDFDVFTLKLDHHFNTTHRASYSFNRQPESARNGFLAQPLPSALGGRSEGLTTLQSLNLTSTVRPNLLNVFRAGVNRPSLRFRAPWELAGTDLQPAARGRAYLIDFLTITDPLTIDNDPQGRITPVYEVGDDVTFLKAKHSFKGGGTLRYVSTNGFNSFDVMPRAVLGAGGVPVANVNLIPGIGLNQASAQNVLLNLTGSVASISQALNARGGTNPQFIPGEGKQRTWKQRELAFYFKDDWKLRSNLTLNLGVRWEYYSVPWDDQGRAASLMGGSGAIFGLAGSSFADLFQPGRLNGSLTRVELVGRNSPNPSRKLYRDDWNNWAPAVGFTWGLPWFGKGRTVLRAGYAVGYERNALRLVDVVAGDAPGLRELVVFRSASPLALSSISLPLAPSGKPLETVPLTDRNQIARVFDTGLRNPYVQNWNLSIQRLLGRDTTLDIRYVGNRGNRLIRGASVNEVNIYETGILDAFLAAQSGGSHPLLDRIFRGLAVPGLGAVDGTRVTGGDLVRSNTTLQGYLAANNAGSFADFLNNSNQYTNERGGLLRRAGLPETFIVPNPQFAAARLTGNLANSTYNSLQVEISRKFSRGFTLLGNYTLSRVFGEEEGSGQEMIDSYRTLRNRRLDRRLMDFHRTHVMRTSGTWELPVGDGKWMGLGRASLLNRVLGGWRTSWIYNVFSGTPIDLTSGAGTVNTFGDNTPDVHGDLSKALGGITRNPGSVQYFGGLSQVDDPYRERIVAANNIRGRSTLRAIAGPDGRVILSNPAPGRLGSLGARFLEGPGSFRLDMDLVKRVNITERVHFELRMDAINVTNSPQFGDPNADINSVDFGRITSASGSRILVIGGRLNF